VTLGIVCNRDDGRYTKIDQTEYPDFPSKAHELTTVRLRVESYRGEPSGFVFLDFKRLQL
jgi:hypothetical protein